MRYRHRVGWFSYHFCIALTVECTVLALVVGTGLWLVGYHLLAVESGSMTPTFRVGDAVIVRYAPPSQLHVGDIVNFVSPENRTKTVSHRIIALNVKDSLLITKGDNIRQADTAIHVTAVRGRVVGVIPHLGQLINQLQTPIGLLLFVCLPLVMSALYESYRLGLSRQSFRYRLGRDFSGL
jgi:signal peptidase I